MKRLILLFAIIKLLSMPVWGLELTAPTVPSSVQRNMPDSSNTLGEGLVEIIKNAVEELAPDLEDAASVCLCIGCCGILVSLIQHIPGSTPWAVEIAGVSGISLLFMDTSGALIRLASDTVNQTYEYAKLYFPVLSAALAAQGGVSSSVALYSGTMIFNVSLSALISKVLIPAVYLFLALAISAGIADQDILNKILEAMKSLITWMLKLVLYGFTGYMSITGVITGNADSSALKITKMAISSMVPVVGGILSNASETVVISAAMTRNAAGIYGLFAFLTICIGPAFRIGVHYLMLKITEGIISVFANKKVVALMGHFSTAMGLLFAMTCTVCVLLLVSTACFMRGVG